MLELVQSLTRTIPDGRRMAGYPCVYLDASGPVRPSELGVSLNYETGPGGNVVLVWKGPPADRIGVWLTTATRVSAAGVLTFGFASGWDALTPEVVIEGKVTIAERKAVDGLLFTTSGRLVNSLVIAAAAARPNTSMEFSLLLTWEYVGGVSGGTATTRGDLLKP